MEYKILDAPDVEELERQINQHVDMGWVLDSYPIPFTREVWDKDDMSLFTKTSLLVVMLK